MKKESLHEINRFTLVLQGELTIRIHTEDDILEKGEAVFFNRNLLHAILFSVLRKRPE